MAQNRISSYAAWKLQHGLSVGLEFDDRKRVFRRGPIAYATDNSTSSSSKKGREDQRGVGMTEKTSHVVVSAARDPTFKRARHHHQLSHPLSAWQHRRLECVPA